MSDGQSKSTRRVVELASIEARQLGHPTVGTEHLLLGLLRVDGDAASALADAGARLTAARHRVSEAVTTPADAPDEGELPYTARARRALDRAARFARQGQRAEVEPVDVLLGVLDVEGLGCQVLRGIGVDVGRLRQPLLPPNDETENPEPITHAAAEPDATGSTPTKVRILDTERATAPTCPSCQASLAETLALRRMPARCDAAEPPDVSPLDVKEVDVAYCGSCGTALGTL